MFFLGKLPKQLPKYIIFPTLVIAIIMGVFGVPSNLSMENIIDNQHRYDTVQSKVDSTMSLSTTDTSIAVSSTGPKIIDSLAIADTLALSPKESKLTPSKPRKPPIEAPITVNNSDSLIYDVNNKTITIYGQGDVKYQDMGLAAEYITINTDTKAVNAKGNYLDNGSAAVSSSSSSSTTGAVDSLTKGEYKKPVFTQKSESYAVDSMDYNMTSHKAIIHGVSTKQGEGFLSGAQIKRMSDGVMHMKNGTYTTCDADHKHFYIAITKGTVVPGKNGRPGKTVFGPSYMVFEDVPFYALGLPFGFFPQTSSRNSGIIFPEIGEEVVKGFFIRNGGYYLVVNENVDLRATIGTYTLGSWQASLGSTYYKRYKYRGQFSFEYASDVIGEVGATDYVNTTNMRLAWTHAQDPKASPGSTFSASVNYSTSNYSKYNAQSQADYLNTQTNSSIAYQKSWAGTPFSLSSTANLSQNMREKEYSFNLPNFNFNVSRITPFKHKIAKGKEKWYEKINMTYSMAFANSTGVIKEENLFKPAMLDNLKTTVSHSIPVSASFNLFQYLNITPSVNYRENWAFRSYEKSWDTNTNAIVTDTVKGFNRIYNYSYSMGFGTNLYGMYTMAWDKRIQLRHVMTPNISMNYTPAFKQFWRTVQTNDPLKPYEYSPYLGAPSSKASASINFGFNNTLEMKVPSDRDTTGVRKIKLIEALGINSSYNFMADSLKLSNFNVSFRTTLFQGMALNVTSVFDPYQLDENGRKIDKFQIRKGSLARLISIGTSVGYNFSSKGSGSGSNSGQAPINSAQGQSQRAADQLQSDAFFNTEQEEQNQVERARLAANQYYDFSIPWSFGFNYSINYSKPALVSKVAQNLTFNGSLTLTNKWALMFNSGYDFDMHKISNADVQISRDLHCWQMTFAWVPIGYRKSWSFTIKANSSQLADLLKWDKRNSYLDNLYGY